MTLSATDCGPSGALSVMRSVAVRRRLAFGFARTPMVQDAPGASCLPVHVSDRTRKSPGFAPARVTFETASVAPPVLCQLHLVAARAAARAGDGAAEAEHRLLAFRCAPEDRSLRRRACSWLPKPERDPVGQTKAIEQRHGGPAYYSRCPRDNRRFTGTGDTDGPDAPLDPDR